MPLARIQVPGPIQAQYLLRGLAPIGVGNRPGSAPSAWLPARLSARLSARLPARLPEWLPGSLLARRSRQHSALFPGEGLRRLPARVWDPCLGPMSGTHVWDPCLGPVSGTPISSPSLALLWPAYPATLGWGARCRARQLPSPPFRHALDPASRGGPCWNTERHAGGRCQAHALLPPQFA